MYIEIQIMQQLRQCIPRTRHYLTRKRLCTQFRWWHTYLTMRTVKNINEEGTLGASVRWWRSSVVIPPVILVWPPIARITISWITSSSEVARCNICRITTTAAATTITTSISVARWPRWVSIIITERASPVKLKVSVSVSYI